MNDTAFVLAMIALPLLLFVGLITAAIVDRERDNMFYVLREIAHGVSDPGKLDKRKWGPTVVSIVVNDDWYYVEVSNKWRAARSGAMRSYNEAVGHLRIVKRSLSRATADGSGDQVLSEEVIL